MNGTIVILNFHGLGAPGNELPRSEWDYWTSAALFKDILDLVHNRDDVQITFDDSNESDYTKALPLLAAQNVNASFFVVAERINQKGYLTRNQLVSLSEAGMTIGTHGMCHRPWSGLNAQRLYEELVEARSRLEQILQKPVSEAACPFGSYNRRVLTALRREGYKRVYTSDGGRTRQKFWLQSRNTVVQKHKLPEIEQIITHQPQGLSTLWRCAKLTAKRLR